LGPVEVGPPIATPARLPRRWPSLPENERRLRMVYVWIDACRSARILNSVLAETPLVFGSARRTQRWANLDRSQPPATSRMSGVRAMRCGDDGRWRNRPTCGAPRESKNPGVSARTEARQRARAMLRSGR